MIRTIKSLKLFQKEEQLEQIKSDGDLIIDSYRVDNYKTEKDFKSYRIIYKGRTYTLPLFFLKTINFCSYLFGKLSKFN